MSRIVAIAYSCDISRDPEENTRNHQAMVDRLNAEVSAAGWAGVKVTMLKTVAGATHVQVEPGVSKLTLDYLRRLREAGRLPDAPPAREPPPPEGRQPLLV